MNEGYSRKPVKGRPLDEGEKLNQHRLLKYEQDTITNERDEVDEEAYKNNDRYRKESKTVKAFGKRSKSVSPDDNNGNGNDITAEGDAHGDKAPPPPVPNEGTIAIKSSNNHSDNDNKNSSERPIGRRSQEEPNEDEIETQGGRRNSTDTSKVENRKRSSTRAWGSALTLSVATPNSSSSWQGVPATILGRTSTSSESSRVWMYGRDAWTALRERCRTAVTRNRGLGVGESGDGGRYPDGEGQAAGDGRETSAADDGEIEEVDVACALAGGTVWGRGGGGGRHEGPGELSLVRGILVPKHVSGVWPAPVARGRLRGRSGDDGDDSPRVVVWKVGGQEEVGVAVSR